MILASTLVCPSCRNALPDPAANSIISCCGTYSKEGSVYNLIGQSAYILSGNRDRILADKLVSYHATQKTAGNLYEFSYALEDARKAALAASLSTADVDELVNCTTFAQVMNNIRDFFVSEGLRPKTPTSEFVDATLKIGPNDRLLDIGCSAGKYLLLGSTTGAELVGIDIDMFALQVASLAWQKSQTSRPPILCAANALQLPLADASCTHVTSFVVLASLPLRAALAEIRRVLRPDGHLIFTIEGPGFLTENWDQPSVSAAQRISLLRWWVGRKLMTTGLDWQGRTFMGKTIAGQTQYSSSEISGFVKQAGFAIETVEILSRYRSQERLIGIVARRTNA